MAPRKASKAVRKTLNLALQGGGAHGAFTWGVLDALLEDNRITFEAVTSASAGSMNAVVLRARLDGWWRRGRASGVTRLLGTGERRFKAVA